MIGFVFERFEYEFFESVFVISDLQTNTEEQFSCFKLIYLKSIRTRFKQQALQ